MQKIFLSLLAVILFTTLSFSGVSASPLYTNPSTTNLVAWWSMNETSGTRNDSYSTNHLTAVNSPSYTSGLVSNAVNFNGVSSEYLSSNDNASLSVGDIDFTICGWIYLLNKTYHSTIVSKSNTASSQGEYYLRYNQTSDRFDFAVFHSGTGSTVVSANNLGSPNTFQYYFVCGYHDSVSNVIGIEVNNTYLDTASHTLGGRDGTSSFQVNRFNSGTAYGVNLQDEIVFYKKVLSSLERGWLYNGGAGRAYCEVAVICPTSTPTFTFTPSLTFTPSNTPVFSFTPSETPVFTATNTAVFTSTYTPVFTSTFTPTDTPTITFTPTSTFTFTPTVTYTPSITPTPSIFPDFIGDLVRDDFYFQVLFLGAFPFLLFQEWVYALIWSLGWTFVYKNGIDPNVFILPFLGIFTLHKSFSVLSLFQTKGHKRNG